MSFPKQTNNSPEIANSTLPEEFLTPEQRLEAVAEILSAVTLRIIKKRQAKETP